MSYDPIISRNRDGSLDHSGNSRSGIYPNGRAAHNERRPDRLQAKLAANKAARQRERHRGLASRLVRDGLGSDDEGQLSDGLLMRSSDVELTDGADYAGHYAYHLDGDRLLMARYGITAVEAAHAAEITDTDGPYPQSLEVLTVRDAAQATEVVRAMELLGWLRRHIDSAEREVVHSLSELEDMFQPVPLPDA